MDFFFNMATVRVTTKPAELGERGNKNHDDFKDI